MKAIIRYLLLLSGIAIFYLIFHIVSQNCSQCHGTICSHSSTIISSSQNGQRKSFYKLGTFQRIAHQFKVVNLTRPQCRMDSCFDFSHCKNVSQGLKIYIYPSEEQNVSPLFGKIINFIKQSKYYEPDPQRACLFISDIDTLDRDRRSSNFKRVPPNLSLLNQGRNHLFFNLFSGSWPDYNEMDFSGYEFPDYAILIKASFSYTNYRPEFDISFPLFLENHPERGPQQVSKELSRVSLTKSPEIVSSGLVELSKYLLVFKGKRYTYGIGGRTRNTLYHLHNGKDILIYTTCKHGKKWKEFVDERCEQDNLEYDKHDYQILMKNSTFCLVPRGRRLGSYRFLEALSFGCIPVVLSNSWVLPFSEIIDWPSAVIMADERLLLQIPDQLRSISQFEIESMRSQGIYLYNTYFSSIGKIILTTMSILEDRINRHRSRERFLWNVANKSPLGSLWIDRRYRDLIEDFPGYYAYKDGFTAIIAVSRVISMFQLNKFLKASLLLSKYVRKVLIIWSIKSVVFPQLTHLAESYPSLITIYVTEESQHIRYSCCSNQSLIPTDAIFQLDPESNLITEEIDFAFLVWQSFAERIVGFSARDHYFDSTKNHWTYTSKWTNQYSIILFDAAIYHKYYNYLYREHISSNSIISSFNFDEECAGLAFNFLISHITRESPIKVTQRKKTIHGETLFNSWLTWIDRKSCFQKLIGLFGYIPLVKSKLRFEPLLYKDAVSSVRKKYRKLEMVV